MILMAVSGPLRNKQANNEQAAVISRAIIDSLPAHIAVLDRTGKILMVNRSWLAYAESNGAKNHPAVSVGSSYLDICREAARQHEHSAQAAIEGIQSVLDGDQKNFEMEYECHAPTEKHWFLMRVSALPEIDGLAGRAVVSHIDITANRMARDALKESEEKYRVAFNSTPDAITITEIPNNRYVYVNDAFTKLTGYCRQEALGRTPLDLKLFVEPADREKLLRMLDETGEISGYELRMRHKDGFVFDSLISVRRLRYENKECVFAVAKDITAVKKAEREKASLEIQLHKAQKMEALGALSGGIAHDFNNILGAIWGYSELALISLPKNAAAREHLEEVVKACKRAKDLIMQILAFSSKKQRERIPVQVHLILKEVLELLRASLPSTIEIRTNINKETDIVQADPTQIHQVIMNLCTNAFYAMSETGGVLQVSQEPVTLDESRPASLSHIKPGPYLKLSVEDTGKGMRPEIMQRIFEPYFTTRQRGQGTGLGLAVSHGIVSSLGGAIIAQSTPGKGSRFDVYFPLTDLPVETSSDTVENYPTGYEGILFVDDEKPLVSLVRQMLENLDYHVVAVSNAATAIAVFSEDPSAFDLIVTDLTMPSMTGFDLAHKIHDIRPEIPIVLMTGYSDQAADKNKLTRAGIRTVLIKPFTFRQLAETVKKALEPDAGQKAYR